jgi:hypothetical protein
MGQNFATPLASHCIFSSLHTKDEREREREREREGSKGGGIERHYI